MKFGREQEKMEPGLYPDVQVPGEYNETVKRLPIWRQWFWWALATILGSTLALIAALFVFSIYSTIKTTEYDSEAEHQYLTPTPCVSVIIDAVHPPIYPAAMQVSNVSVTEQEEQNWSSLLFTRTFQTMDNPKTVLDYYRDVMPKEGWALKPPDIWEPRMLEPEVVTLQGITGISGFFETCPYSSSHYHYTYLVVRSLMNSPTLVNMRVYEYR